MTATDLSGKVALVTGASRGVGRGIALALGEAGATVYVTGRTTVEDSAASGLPGTVIQTAKDINETGGSGFAIPMDANDDGQMADVVSRVESEQGRLDILVNSTWGGYERFTDGTYVWGPFWEQPLALWDSMNRIGVRAHYVMSALAAPLMIRTGHGLIVTLSSFAARVFTPPVAYGVAHAAIDRLAKDMAEELRPHQVTSIALYPGLVLTESVLANIEFFMDEPNRETPLFIGRTVAALANDTSVFRFTGQALVAAEVAAAYNVLDENGHRPGSSRMQFTGEDTKVIR